MQNVLRLAIVDPSDTSRNQLKNMLLGMDMVWLDAESSRYEFFADVLAQTKPDIGLVVVDQDPEGALAMVEKVTRTAPDTAILVVSSSSDGQLILRAMRAGAKEFLAQPLRLEDLVAALERLSKLKFGGSDGKVRGCTVIAVAGATGGVGTTSLAVNLGCALAANRSRSVALVDLDLALGDADVFLDTIPDYTLVDVAQNVTRLDFNLLKRSLTKHSSGLFLLPRPVQMEDAEEVTPEDLQRVIGLLKATFTHLLIDLSKSYTPLDRVALQMAEHVLLVTQMDLPCLRNVVRLMVSFGEMQGVANKVKIVLNRAGLDTTPISTKKAQETMGREIFWQVPNDYRTMVGVRNNGVPLLEQAPKAKVTQSIIDLAETLAGNRQVSEEVAAPGEANKGTLGKLLGFWGKQPAG